MRNMYDLWLRFYLQLVFDSKFRQNIIFILVYNKVIIFNFNSSVMPNSCKIRPASTPQPPCGTAGAAGPVGARESVGSGSGTRVIIADKRN